MSTPDTVKAQLQSVINSANSKTGKNDGDVTSAVASLISGFGVGGDPVIQALEITENGTYTAPDGVDGYSPVTVNVAASGGGYALMTGSVTIEEDTDILKITGLGKPPIAACIYPNGTSEEFLNGAAKQLAGFWLNGLFASYRTNVGGTSVVEAGNNIFTYGDFAVKPDNVTIQKSPVGVFALETGFAMYRASYPFRAGTTYNWAAIV